MTSPLSNLRTRVRSVFHRPGWRGWFSIGLIVVCVAIVIAWAIDYRTLGDRVARNVTIENIDIGRLDGVALQRALDTADQRYGSGSVEFVIKGESTFVKAHDIGLRLDEKATMDAARRIGRDDPTLLKPVYWAASFFVPRRAPARIRLDNAELTRALSELPGQKLAIEPQVVGSTGSVGVREGKAGYGFDPDKVSTRIISVARNGQLPIRVPLSAAPLQPRISMESVKLLAVKGYQMTKAPITLTAPKGSMVVPPTVLRSWITSKVSADGKSAHLAIDGPVSRKAVQQQLGIVQEPANDAAFTVENSQVRLVPDSNGTKCCTEKVGSVIFDALDNGRDEVAVPLSKFKADFSTEDAKKLGITTLLGPAGPASESPSPTPTPSTTQNGAQGTPTTTTLPRSTKGSAVVPLPNKPGIRENVEFAIPKLRGRIIMPHKSLSLHAILGPPDPDLGFVPAAMDTADGPSWIAGGGTDLVAAALFRAAFDGGLDIPTSTRHGIALQGVPLGVEATLGWPEPDLVIRNPSANAVLVWVDLTRGGVRVQLFSTPFTSSVTSSTNQVPFGPERRCLAVTVTRSRTFLSGRAETDRFSARYTPPPGARDDPERVICPRS